MKLKQRTTISVIRYAIASVCVILALSAGTAHTQSPLGYEVWLVDQNNTVGYSAAVPRGTHGGRLLIYDSADLDNPAGPVNNPTVIELSQLFAIDGPNNKTGANVARPHMALPSPDGRKYMAIAFVVSGHVAIFDGATKQPKALF